MATVTISKEEYERLKRIEAEQEAVASVDRSLKDAQEGSVIPAR